MAAGDMVVRIAGEIEGLKAQMAEAAESLKKLEESTKRAQVAAEDMSGSMGTLTAFVQGFVGAFTVDKIIGFVEHIADSASHLVDLSNQTHVSIEDLQILTGAMSEFGVSGDQVARGIFQLSRRIAKGDDSVVDALDAMGLSLRDVADLTGKDLFTTILHGLSTLQGGFRDDTAYKLFGAHLGQVMAGASEDIEGALATWQKLNHVASTESVKALDEYSEALTRMFSIVSSAATDRLGALAQGLLAINAAQENGVSIWQQIGAAASDAWNRQIDAARAWTNGMGSVTPRLSELTKLYDEANQRATAHAATTTAAGEAHERAAKKVKDHHVALSAFEKAMIELNSAGGNWRETLDTIDGETVSAVQYYLQAGVAQGTLAAAYGLTATQIKAVVEQLKDENEHRRLFAAQHKAWLADEMKAEQEQGDLETMLTEAAWKHQKQREAETKKALAATNAAVIEHYHTWVKESAEAAATSTVDITNYARLNIELQGKMQDAIRQTYSINSTFSLNPQGDLASQAAARGGVVARDDYGNPYVYIPGVNAPGHRAGGGPVSAGEPYMVGERGPELFVPQSAGSVVSNSQINAPMQVTIYVNGTAADVARQVADELMRTATAGRKYSA